MKPRVLFVGRTRYDLPLPAGLARKWDAIGERMDYRVLGCAEWGGGAGDERFELLPPVRPRRLDGVAFYALLPFRVRRSLRRTRPRAVFAESPQIGAAVVMGRWLAGKPRARLVVEVHGDWRYATRLYGSPVRRVVSPLSDALSAWALRRADAVRALSPFTARLVEETTGRPAAGRFPTYSDLSAFTAGPHLPLPGSPSLLFVGSVEPTKGVDTLVEAWRSVAGTLQEARLVVVGRGSLEPVVERLVNELPDRVEHVAELSPEEVAARMDAATALVLPSLSEGLGRVIIESFARGRGVVASSTGGIEDLVTDGVEGLLVPPGDAAALAAALVRVLSDPALAERLGSAASARFEALGLTLERYADQIAALAT
jgi:glycosyltransferase involved in cell wall biosynthesis